ncbi:hypothetical protein KW797_00830, partial [Candidatus Parcubacteria bacterium]|nr:hypothetical protein [Candidatus Parcubacteria bacterium]
MSFWSEVPRFIKAGWEFFAGSPVERIYESVKFEAAGRNALSDKELNLVLRALLVMDFSQEALEKEPRLVGELRYRFIRAGLGHGRDKVLLEYLAK